MHAAAVPVLMSAMVKAPLVRARSPKVRPRIGDLMAALAAQGVEPVGAVFAHHSENEPGHLQFRIGCKGLGTRAGYRTRETILRMKPQCPPAGVSSF